MRRAAAALVAVVLLVSVVALMVRAQSPGSGPGTASPTVSGSGPASTAQPAPQTPASTWAATVAAENAKPGLADALVPRSRGAAPGLAAYADRVSVRPGEEVGLYVSADSPQTVTVRALRVGYYGGLGFREVWSGTLAANRQPGPATLTAPLVDAGGATGTQARYAPWTLSLLVPTTGWPEGQYVLRLDGTSASRYVPLTVRSASAVGRVLVVSAPMTWEAYNDWGGRSLYGDEAKTFALRSTAVSFDRPYADGYGAGGYFTYDAPIDREAERLGLPLAWATDYDIANDPSLLSGATAVVFGSHTEYWTGRMHDAVVAAVASGTNAAFFGANTSYWRVRLAGGSVGLAAQPDRRDGSPRVVFGPKDAALDPLAASDPAGATARFRDAPHSRPEELLTGMRYDCYPAKGDWVVADPSWWGYAGTGLTAGSRIPGVLGPETDRVYPAADRPQPMQVVAYSSLSCGHKATFHTGVYWTNTAGAGVFAAGTMGWSTGMRSGTVGDVVTRITANVLTRFAQPHAGTAYPAVDDVSRYRLPTRTTTGAS